MERSLGRMEQRLTPTLASFRAGFFVTKNERKMELKYLDEYGLLKQPVEALVEYVLQLRAAPKPEPESKLKARIEELEGQNEELEDELSNLRSEKDELEEQLELENLLAKEKSKLDKLAYLSSQYDKESGLDLSKALELAVRLLESELNKRTQPNLFDEDINQ